MKPTLLVLAAGMGSRFGGLKQIEPVGPNGEWILDFSVYDAIATGFGKAVFVIREEMEEAFEVVRKRYESRIDVRFAFQKRDDIPCRKELAANRQKPWGTGHAVFAARTELDAPFAVINADDFYGSDAFQALSRFLSNPSLPSDAYSLVGYKLANTLSESGAVSRGVCRSSEDHLLESVEEHTNIRRDSQSGNITALDSKGKSLTLSDDCLVSLNCWGFPVAFTSKLKGLLETFLSDQDDQSQSEFYLPFAVDQLIRSGEATAKILECSSRWLGVTHRDDLPFVKKEIAGLFEKGDYTAPLW